MASKSTRYQLVTRALTLAGRDIRLRSEAEQWLNDMLRAWAFEFKYPSLRKTGSPITFATGTSYATLPSDMGAGMDNLLIGQGRLPLYERSMDEFVAALGFAKVENPATGLPTMYAIDQNAGLFRFDRTADQNYELIPIYYSCPAPISQDPTGDASPVWMDDDQLVVQGLIEIIYQYTGDQREIVQNQKVDKLKSKYRTGAVPMGGGSTRITLARTRFK